MIDQMAMIDLSPPIMPTGLARIWRIGVGNSHFDHTTIALAKRA